jgi:small conductance mechanosensitive channel
MLASLFQPLQAARTCDSDGSGWCAAIHNWTAMNDLFSLAVTKTIQLLLIVLGALLIRYYLHRLITRLTRSNGRGPKLLRPLKERFGDTASLAAQSERRQQRALTLGSVLKSIVSFVVFGVAAMYLMQLLGVNLAPVLASAGVVGVAVAFGAQNLVRDFLSGMFMMVEDQYGVGDVVDLGEANGTVESVGLRVTTLRDLYGTVWYVRNGEIQRVGNSSQGFAYAVVDLPLAHRSNVQKAIEVATAVATDSAAKEPLAKDVLDAPQMLGVNQITSDTVTLRLTAKVRPGQQWAVQRKLRADIKRAYDEADIQPPYPNGHAYGPSDYDSQHS